MPRRKPPRGLVRRGQLIAPFGVGAMVVMEGGTSLITAGLDHWYVRETGETDSLNVEEFIVREWRLERELNVTHFRLPPDHRAKGRGVNNWGLTIPALRFPTWHFCRVCNYMFEVPLSAIEDPVCPECRKGNRKGTDVVQVPLVALCERGHIQDFPWREWVHGSEPCNGKLRLISTGGATLAGTKVVCDCGKKRNLGAAIGELPEAEKESARKIKCNGKRPWLGTFEGEPCDAVLRGSLRSASNVYFAQIRSSIFLPQETSEVSEDLLSILREPMPSQLIQLAAEANHDLPPERLRQHGYEVRLRGYSDEQIRVAIDVILGRVPAKTEQVPHVPSDDSETRFRRAEYLVLQNERSDSTLEIRRVPLEEYDGDVAWFFDRIMLITKLRETRAFAGFTRVNGDVDVDYRVLKSLLWREKPETGEWLPVNIVYGEGIFLQLRDDLIRRWKPYARERISLLTKRYEVARQERGLRTRNLTPRFVLLHTLAHILINQLVFECGYSSASLRERLYVSDDEKNPMAGILIYTAAGDSEGTMGGLVRMGRPGFFEPVVRRALEAARWCSCDPICMEIAEQAGQGPDSCNLAACHSCALLPETACEEFNRFLDRALLIGDLNNHCVGFFNQCAEPDSRG